MKPVLEEPTDHQMGLSILRYVHTHTHFIIKKINQVNGYLEPLLKDVEAYHDSLKKHQVLVEGNFEIIDNFVEKLKGKPENVLLTSSTIDTKRIPKNSEPLTNDSKPDLESSEAEQKFTKIEKIQNSIIQTSEFSKYQKTDKLEFGLQRKKTKDFSQNCEESKFKRKKKKRKFTSALDFMEEKIRRFEEEHIDQEKHKKANKMGKLKPSLKLFLRELDRIEYPQISEHVDLSRTNSSPRKSTEDGSWYEGQWWHKKKEGRGKWVREDGEEMYEGEWKDGKRWGYGREVKVGGRVKEGWFEDGVFVGGGKEQGGCKVLWEDFGEDSSSGGGEI